jgi:hypothetical protein
VEFKPGPLGTSAIYWPIVPAPGDCEDGEFGAMNWQGKPKYSEKTCPGATLSTTNSTWSDPGSNPDRRGGKPAINCLSYGAALWHLAGCCNYISWGWIQIFVHFFLLRNFMFPYHSLLAYVEIDVRNRSRPGTYMHIHTNFPWLPPHYIPRHIAIIFEIEKTSLNKLSNISW